MVHENDHQNFILTIQISSDSQLSTPNPHINGGTEECNQESTNYFCYPLDM